LAFIRTFGPVEERVHKQLERCVEAGNAPYAVLCADNHLGYSQPIGAAIAYRDFISPSGVGYDIGCGNYAVQTPLKVANIKINEVMDEITNIISFGIGRRNKKTSR
jgi:tRNA-splicing ligase RtcB (3'-phosphate/5'-hydroxy nucleic acid ligase)